MDKKEALGQIVLKKYQTQKEIDEAWLRWYVYGDIEEREECDIYPRVRDGLCNSKKFPTKFLSALIEHIIHCDKCADEYEVVGIVNDPTYDS